MSFRFGLVFLVLGSALACGKDRSPESSSATGATGATGSTATVPGANASPQMPKVATAAHASASAAVVAAPLATSAAALDASLAAPLADLDCRVTSGQDTVVVHLALSTMSGSLAIDGSQTRRLVGHGTPYAGTYLLLFQSAGVGDKPPAGEHLNAGKSILVRLVGNGNDLDLYLDGDVKIASARGPLRCAR